MFDAPLVKHSIGFIYLSALLNNVLTLFWNHCIYGLFWKETGTLKFSFCFYFIWRACLMFALILKCSCHKLCHICLNMLCILHNLVISLLWILVYAVYLWPILTWLMDFVSSSIQQTSIQQVLSWFTFFLLNSHGT